MNRTGTLDTPIRWNVSSMLFHMRSPLKSPVATSRSSFVWMTIVSSQIPCDRMPPISVSDIPPEYSFDVSMKLSALVGEVAASAMSRASRRIRSECSASLSEPRRCQAEVPTHSGETTIPVDP